MHTSKENIKQEIQDLINKKNEIDKQIAKLEYEANRIHANDDVNQFLHGYYGVQLLMKHKLTDHGQWEIVGEDPNCDLAGTHINPHIAYVEGTLEEAIKYAVKQPKWYTWGGGGNIRPIMQKNIIKL